MSSDIAIKIENLGKCYQIYSQPHDRLKQSICPRIQRLCGRQPKQYFREFWALRDTSFEIKKGETVGIIGRNGSGKSTLLQMICGILNPTTGSIKIKGRIAALLELGSGFNPEFSGRENVYMNAALLGLTRAQVEARFDDIAAFADIGDFIEQPVKTYSSGMYVRLAFAVIAHVDADILVVDEALAVGDAIFTQKCMRFIREFQKRGTLLFVSHDISSVQNLCRSTIWLANGQVRQSGTSKEVTQAYLQYTLQEVYGEQIKLRDETPAKSLEKSAADHVDMAPENTMVNYGSTYEVEQNIHAATGWKTGAAEIVNVELKNIAPDGDPSLFRGWENVRLTIRAVAHSDLVSPIIGFLVRDRLGQDLFGENTLPFTTTKPVQVIAGQTFYAEFEFRLPMLPNGQFAVMASIADGDLYNNIQHHWLHDAFIINVSSSEVRWGLVGVPFNRISLQAQASND